MAELIHFTDVGIRYCSHDGNREFFDPDKFGWTTMLEDNWIHILGELNQVLEERDNIPNFQDISEEQKVLTTDDKWKTFFMYVFGTPIKKNCQKCPKTVALLQTIPGLKNAMFSILSPHKSIPEHRGPTKGVLRYHLALKVPKSSESCTIKVNGQSHSWIEGKTLIFDDTFQHSVCNNTDEERVVLFADFERPLPWPLAIINKAVLALIAKTQFAKRPINILERE